MDITQYNHLFNYLQNQILPDELTLTQQQKLVKQSRYFEIKNNYLYKHVRQNFLESFDHMKWKLYFTFT